MFNTRIRVPDSATAGAFGEIRAMVMHPVVNGYAYSTTGTLIPEGANMQTVAEADALATR